MSVQGFSEYVDAYQVFTNEACFSAVVSAEKLQRLRQYLYVDEPSAELPEFKVDLEFSKDISGHRVVSGQISGTVVLECQRCMQGMQHKLLVSTELVVVDTDEKAKQIDDGREVVITTYREDQRILDVLALVEDELILGLPLAPRHNEGKCQAQQTKPASEQLAKSGGIARDNPAALNTLMALKASLAKSSDDES